MDDVGEGVGKEGHMRGGKGEEVEVGKEGIVKEGGCMTRGHSSINFFIFSTQFILFQ